MFKTSLNIKIKFNKRSINLILKAFRIIWNKMKIKGNTLISIIKTNNFLILQHSNIKHYYQAKKLKPRIIIVIWAKILKPLNKKIPTNMIIIHIKKKLLVTLTQMTCFKTLIVNLIKYSHDLNKIINYHFLTNLNEKELSWLRNFYNN